MTLNCRCRHLNLGSIPHRIDGIDIELCPLCDKIVSWLLLSKADSLSLIESLASNGILDAALKDDPSSPPATDLLAIPSPDEIAMMVSGPREVPVMGDEDSVVWHDEVLPPALSES